MMNAPLKLLLAVDFTPQTPTLLSQLLPFIRLWDADVVLLHVLKTSGHNFTPSVKAYREATGKLLQLRDDLQMQGISSLPLVGHHTSLAEGIREAAQAHAADMVVFLAASAAKGHMAKRGLLDHMLAVCDKPIWVLKAPVPYPFRRLLCALDFSPPSQHALQQALVLSRQFEAPLTIVHVLSSADHSAETARHKMDILLGDSDRAGLEYTLQVIKGKVADKLIAVITEEEIDLVLMGASGVHHPDKHGVGQVLRRLIPQVHCSLMTFRSENFRQRLLTHMLQQVEGDFNQAKELLEKGFAQEAIQIFEGLLEQNLMFAPAWEGLARAHHLLGHEAQAEEYEQHVRLIRERLCWKKIEYDVKHQYQPGSQKRT